MPAAAEKGSVVHETDEAFLHSLDEGAEQSAPSVAVGDTVLYRPNEFDVHVVRNTGGHATGSDVFAAIVTYVHSDVTVDLVFFGPGSQKAIPRGTVHRGHPDSNDADTWVAR